MRIFFKLTACNLKAGVTCFATDLYALETVQDFWSSLGIKPLMHLLEISTFSLNNAIVRLTKIMNRADKNWAYLKLRILRSLTRLFIILVNLTRSIFSEKCLFPIDALVVWCPAWSKNLRLSLIKAANVFFVTFTLSTKHNR